jgi:hypothetical protein
MLRLPLRFTIVVLTPAVLAAQQSPVARLRTVLPSDVADQVVAIVTDALSRGHPPNPVALRALEGAAKGKSAKEIVAAAQSVADLLSKADTALEWSGRTAKPDEIAAAAATMQLGVDGDVVSDLASGAPSGRSLAVPLAVIGALVSRGVPADDALAAVLAKLQARASNADLAALPARAKIGRGLGARGAGRGPTRIPAAVPTNGGHPGRRPGGPPPDGL